MSGCYISTAVMTAKGFDDNHPALVSLRNYRDTYMKATPERAALVKEYYTTAPDILRAIEIRPDSNNILLTLYDNYLTRAIKAIELGKNEIALNIYKQMYLYLKTLSGVNNG